MPDLLAEFELDKEEKPKRFVAGDLNHYNLRLFVRNAPADASSVKYILHPTYIEPIRVVPKGAPEFEEYTTSYGDYDLRGIINRRNGAEQIRTTLTEALRRRYQDELNPAIKQAIEELKQH